MKLLWADLHNHNAIGYGQGSPERSYAIARGAMLDACCFTPHGLWHDLPAGDARIAEFHREGFERVRREWPRVRRLAESWNAPGEFAALLGFEWHSSRHGDWCAILPGGEGEPCAAASLAELQEFARKSGALLIPHHGAYRAGWRGTEWEALDPELSPVVEAFSEHGCSMEAESGAAMLPHSMGGSERSQTVMERLRRGLVAGVIGSTDNHWGHPASYGEGLAGIWAADATREAVLEALRRRHTYAATGDRIALRVEAGGSGTMGDVLPAAARRELVCRVQALGELDYVRVFRNGRPVHDVLPPPPRADDPAWTVRLDFGWGAMTGGEVTGWRIRVRVDGALVAGIHPCFAGGAGSVEKLNRVAAASDGAVELEAYTSRRNSRPTSGLALRLEGGAAARVEVEAEADWDGRPCGCRVGARLGELLARDEWAAVSETFSAPRLRLGRAHGCSETDVDLHWTDPEPGGDDWYLVKVLQANGQAAWSSPVWFRG